MCVKIHGALGEIETYVDVCIKEFYMQDFYGRNNDGAVTSVTDSQLASQYGDKFKKEAINLSHLAHPNIVKVLEVFDANDTHYYVMEYIEGETLDEYAIQKGGIPEAEALGYIRTVSMALSYMHSKRMLHLDVKPKNIMRRNIDGRVFLIDFGLSKQYNDIGEAESSTTIGLGTPGYAPLEQCDGIDTKSFPVTIDIYSIGATLFKLLTSLTPPKASDIINEGLPIDALIRRNVSKKTIDFVSRTMQPLKKNRPQNMEAVLMMLNNDDEATVYETPEQYIYDETASESKVPKDDDSNKDDRISKGASKRILLMLCILCVISIILIGGVLIGNAHHNAETRSVPDTVEDVTEGEHNATSHPITFTDNNNKSFSFEGELYSDGTPKKGTAKYEDGRTYEGSFLNNLPDGDVGVMTQKNGDVYEGSFTNGFYQKGKYTSKEDGFYFEGTFKEGNPYNGTWYTPNGEVDTRIVNGK